jgi:hypothetical protein
VRKVTSGIESPTFKAVTTGSACASTQPSIKRLRARLIMVREVDLEAINYLQPFLPLQLLLSDPDLSDFFSGIGYRRAFGIGQICQKA